MLGELFHKQLTHPTIPSPAKCGRGRSADLVDRRNEKLAYRYYYKARILQIMDWNVIVTELSSEFDLAEATIIKTITITLSDTTRQIFNEKPTLKDLKSRFPYLVW